MAEVEADAHVVEVRCPNEFHQFVRSRKLVGNVLQQNTHAQRLGECTQVFNRSHGGFEFAFIKIFATCPKVLDQEAKRYLFGDFERALDFVHRLDAAGAVGGSYVDGQRAGASEFVVSIERGVHRVQRNTAGLEPVRDLAHVLLAVGIVQVLASREDFDCLRTASSQAIQNAGMEPLLDI